MGRRHIHTCAFTDEKVNILEDDTVMIAGSHNGILFKCYVRMDVFFERFANRPEAPAQLPGLTPYKSHRHPRIRWKFNPSRFGASLDKWRGGPGETFNTLMKDGGNRRQPISGDNRLDRIVNANRVKPKN